MTGERRVRRVLEARFRANPAYRLVPQAELSGRPAELLEGLAERADHFGVLVPDGDHALTVHAVDGTAASLFDALRRAGPLPGELRSGDDGANARVAAMVLDGIVEIEAASGFRSGPAAHDDVFESTLDAPPADSRVAELSMAALHSALATPLAEPRPVGGWLYRYNTVPVGPWHARHLGGSAFPGAVGLTPGGPAALRLDERYRSSSSEAWLSWDRMDSGFRTTPKHKIYVSPAPAALSDAVPKAIACLVDCGAPAFKLGADPYGLLRPDKLMIYLHSRDELMELAEELGRHLDGLPAQGVPFTAPLGTDGMLSWGVDPPFAERVRGLAGWESWRVWVTGRLAGALIAGRRHWGAHPAAVWFALDRVALDGIDPVTWLPDGPLWDHTDDAR